MWASIIIFSIVILFLCIELRGEKIEKTKRIKCKYCGDEYDRDESKIVMYKFSGKLEKCQECPKCGYYNKTQ